LSKHWYIKHLISKNTKDKSRGLDIGSGNDNWKEVKHCKFANIDKYQPKNMSFSYDSFDIVDIEKDDLPFADNSFDVIISINVLNSLINYRVINEIYRVLIKNGMFIVVVDNEKANQQGTMTQTKLRLLFPNDKFVFKMNLFDRFLAWYYNKTSVYAFTIIIKK